MTKKPGAIQRVIGEAISTKEKSADQIKQEVYEWISEKRHEIELSN